MRPQTKLAVVSDNARPSAANDSFEPVTDAIAPIERLPKWLLCAPLVAQWLWLALKYRSVTLPSVLNPEIETGGLVGESKLAYLSRIDAALSQYVAKAVAVYPGEDPDLVRRTAGLSYPLIAKPDIGWCGYGVRRIDSAVELAAYAASFPQSGKFLVQRLADVIGEAGILYVREPGKTAGRIAAMTIRHLPQVCGDGQRSIEDLISQSPRTSLKAHVYRRCMSTEALARIPDRNERVTLTTVASVRVGGRYEDATALVTPVLEQAVDRISRSMGEFHYGRFDVKFDTRVNLRAGRFTIIEVNGAGSEAIQFWDPRLAMGEAFKGVFAKQRTLFALAHAMRKRGFKPIGVKALISAFLRQRQLVKRYPPSN